MYQDEKTLIEQSGLTATYQRILILHYILFIADHPSAEDVMSWLKENCPKVSAATVYNTLNTFVEKGIIKSFNLPGSKTIHYDKNTEHHYHLIDMETGDLTDLDESALDVIPKIKDFEIQKVDIFIYGKKS